MFNGRGVLIAIAVLGAFLMFALVVVGCGVSFYNTAVRSENGIKAQYTQNKNNYDNYFKKLKESAQVPTMYSEDMKKVWDDVMRGRYGDKGSGAMMQWIQEHNPSLDPGLYRELQQVIESGRNSFEADQKQLIAKKQAYENHLGIFPNSLFAGFLSFPRLDLSKFDIVTSSETERVFDTKKSDPIDIRGNK